MDDFYNSTDDVSTQDAVDETPGGRTIAKEFLSRCHRTRWVGNGSPSASELGTIIAKWAGFHGNIAAVDVITAAKELGFICGRSEHAIFALIGVNRDDVAARLAERVEPSKPKEENFFKQYAREHGLRTNGEGETITFMSATTPPPPREYAVPGRVPLRQVTLLAGAGGIGKSMVALDLLCSTVLGSDWLGSKPMPGPAIYLGAEDPEDEVHHRLADIAAHHGETLAELFANGLYPRSYFGEDMTLARFDSDGMIEPTALYYDLWKTACDIRPVIIVLDTLSDIFGGDENNRAQVSAFVGLLRNLAEAANCAIIVTQHPSQAGANSGSGTSGSTAWHGKVRGRMYLRAATKDESASTNPDLRVLEFMKNQYGALAPKVTLRFENGVFVPEMPGGSADPLVADQRSEQVFMNLLDRFTRGGRNVTDKKGTSYAPALFAKETEAKAVNLNSKALEGAMRRLFAENRIRVVTDGPPSKPRSKLVAVRP
ncbi:AAA family ATPase [Bradyrhizobium yuanmingense]|uniref:AAA family ATPase n=1 Tax=Bradyrhizobium yuanmingense TaxID=108015 RepID=UPI0023BA258A|nr:AAA family ATPase [Bradyrhizobium yuanmingense]MDF0523166.1 AAA family ATPase [Bradyrhizobium yuanmingense]